MATLANPSESPKPAGGPKSSVPSTAQATYATYVDAQLDRTRDQLRFIETSSEAVVLALLVLAYIGLGVLADHWLIEGGLGTLGRTFACLGLVAGVVIYFCLRILPWMVNRINPLYAAAEIERSQPTIKNSLINFLFLRRTPPPPGVMHAVEQRAAADLSHAPLDAVVDRSRLLRGAVVLLAFTALACGYKLLSPKDPFRSVTRIMFPWANLAPPTRVAISDVAPGDAAVYVGDELTVKAKVSGVRLNEPVKAIFTSRDGAIVERPIVMKRAEAGNEYSVALPDEPGGLSGDVDYYLAAGDVRTEPYHVSVRPAPTMVVTKVELNYPAYTGYSPEVRRSGDFDAIEGTEVVLHGEANQDISLRSASADFGCDGVHPYLRMESSGRTAFGKFVLSADPEAKHETYLLQFTNVEGRKNPKPVRHRIGILRDIPPTVAFAAPAKNVQIPLNGSVVLHLKAEDPDFALANVELTLTTNTGKTLLKTKEKTLLNEPHDGPWEQRFTFAPANYNLKSGEIVTYTATVKDVKSPNPNVVTTEPFQIEIISAMERPAPDQVADANDAQGGPMGQAGPPPANDANRKPQDGPPADGPKQENDKPQDGPPAEPRGPQDGPKQEGEGGKTQDQVAQNDAPQDEGGVVENLADYLNPKPSPEDGENQEPQNKEPGEKGAMNEEPKESAIGGDQNGPKQSASGGTDANEGEDDPNGKGEGRPGVKGKDEKEPGASAQQQPGEAGKEPQAGKQPGGAAGADQKEPNEPGAGEERNPANGGKKPEREAGKAGANADQGNDPQRPKNPADRNQGEKNPGDKPAGEEEQPGPDQAGAQRPMPNQPGGEQQPYDGDSGSPMPEMGEKPNDASGGGESGKPEQSGGGKKPEKQQGASRGGEQPQQGGAGEEQPGSGKPMGQDPPMGEGAGAGAGEKTEGAAKKPQAGGGKAPQDGASQPGQGDPSKQSGGGSKPQAGDGMGQQPGSTPPADNANRGKPDQQPGDSGKSPAGGKPNEGREPGSNPAGQGDPKDPNAQPSEEEPGPNDPKAGSQARGDKPQKGQRRPNPDPDNEPEEPTRESPQTGGPGDGGQAKPAQQQREGERSKDEQPDAKGGDPTGTKSPGGAAPPTEGDEGSGSTFEGMETKQQRSDRADEKPTEEGKRNSDEPNSAAMKNEKPSDGKARQNTTGEQSGAGGQGAGGEQANQAGNGGAGKNTSANEGSGQSSEAGDGAASNRPGDSKPSGTPTGQPGQDKGNGSSSRENPNGSQSGSNDPTGKPAMKPANQSGEQKPQEGAGTEGNAPNNRNRQETNAEKPSSGGTPTGGGGSRAPGDDAGGAQDGSQEVGEDAANDEYAQETLDLVLEKLKEQLGKEKVDPELLKRSGFRSREELEAWVKQWETLREQAKQTGELGDAAKRKLDERLRGLGLTRPGRSIESAKTPGDDVRKLRENTRVLPPAEYSEAADAYESGIKKRLPTTTVD